MKKTKEETVEEALTYFKEGFACSQSAFIPFALNFGIDKEQALAISSTLGGGMGRLGRTCGAVTGCFMALGLKFGNVTSEEKNKKLNAYRKVREMNKSFEKEFGSSVCKEILKAVAVKNQKDGKYSGSKICDQCVKRAVELTYNIINEN